MPGLLARTAEQAALQPAAPGQAITACSLYADAGGWLQARLKPQGEAGLLDDPAPAAEGPAVYCLVARASGLLQVFAAPGLQLLAEFGALPDGPEVLLPRETGELPNPFRVLADVHESPCTS